MKRPSIENNDMFALFPEWEGMPEFHMEKQEPYSQIIIRFDNDDDMQDFAKIIGQKLTKKTTSLWHPALIRGINAKKRWVDE